MKALAAFVIGLVLASAPLALAKDQRPTQHLNVQQGDKVVLHVTDTTGYAEDSMCLYNRGTKAKNNVRIVIKLDHIDRC